MPVVQGVVVRAADAPALLAKIREASAAAEEKAQQKRSSRILGNWSLLVRGLLIREKLQKEYQKDAKGAAAAAAGGAGTAGGGAGGSGR